VRSQESLRNFCVPHGARYENDQRHRDKLSMRHEDTQRNRTERAYASPEFLLNLRSVMRISEWTFGTIRRVRVDATPQVREFVRRSRGKSAGSQLVSSAERSGKRNSRGVLALTDIRPRISPRYRRFRARVSLAALLREAALLSLDAHRSYTPLLFPRAFPSSIFSVGYTDLRTSLRPDAH